MRRGLTRDIPGPVAMSMTSPLAFIIIALIVLASADFGAEVDSRGFISEDFVSVLPDVEDSEHPTVARAAQTDRPMHIVRFIRIKGCSPLRRAPTGTRSALAFWRAHCPRKGDFERRRSLDSRTRGAIGRRLLAQSLARVACPRLGVGMVGQSNAPSARCHEPATLQGCHGLTAPRGKPCSARWDSHPVAHDARLPFPSASDGRGKERASCIATPATAPHRRKRRRARLDAK